MKKIFLWLACLNFAFFLWHELLADKEPIERQIAETSASRDSKLKTVALLREARRQPGGAEKASGESALLLGGFVSEEQQSALAQRLMTMGIAAEKVVEANELDVEFWVVLPPVASKAASLRLLKELQARRLDGFLITSGEQENGISLGIYQTEEAARGMQERMRTAGYGAAIQEKVKARNKYWLAISSASLRLVDQNMLDKLAVDFPEMQHKQQIRK